jgi:hypothetical protein
LRGSDGSALVSFADAGLGATRAPAAAIGISRSGATGPEVVHDKRAMLLRHCAVAPTAA